MIYRYIDDLDDIDDLKIKTYRVKYIVYRSGKYCRSYVYKAPSSKIPDNCQLFSANHNS